MRRTSDQQFANMWPLFFNFQEPEIVLLIRPMRQMLSPQLYSGTSKSFRWQFEIKLARLKPE